MSEFLLHNGPRTKTSNFVGYPRYPDYINNVRHVHPISKEKGKQEREYIQEKDNATKNFGEKPTPEQIIEKYKGMVYQRRKSVIPTKSDQHIPKVKISPHVELNIDLGNWLSSAQIPIPVIEILKIPSQRDIFMKTLEEPKEKIVEKPKVVAERLRKK